MHSHGVDEEKLLLGTDLEKRDFNNLLSRQTWDTYLRVLDNLEPFLDDQAIDEIGLYGVTGREYQKLTNIVSGIFSTKLLYWAQSKFMGNYLFNNIKFEYKKDSRNLVSLEMSVEGEPPPMFFWKGYVSVYRHFPKIFDNTLSSKVVLTKVDSNTARFLISPPIHQSIFKRVLLTLSAPFRASNTVELLSELEQSKREVSELNMLLSDKLNDKSIQLMSLSHDLSNPLFIITGLKKRIDRAKSLEEVKGYIESINSHATIMAHTIKQTRSFLEKENNGYKKCPISMKKLIDDSIQLTQARADKKEIELKINVVDSTILGDESAISCSVITNIITNAIKFSNTGGTIEINSYPKYHDAILEVIDFGTGMDEETRKRIQNGDKVISKEGTVKEQGSGFGMMIAKNIIEKFDGTMHIETNENIGTKFTIVWPQAMQHLSNLHPSM
jgi:signal transduction histidine kinase